MGTNRQILPSQKNFPPVLTMEPEFWYAGAAQVELPIYYYQAWQHVRPIYVDWLETWFALQPSFFKIYIDDDNTRVRFIDIGKAVDVIVFINKNGRAILNKEVWPHVITRLREIYERRNLRSV